MKKVILGIISYDTVSTKKTYAPKGSAKALLIGSNLFSYGLLSLVNEEWSFNFAWVIRRKNSAENLHFSDGWVGGDQKFTSIFLFFKYVEDNVYTYLFMYSKVITKILMAFKIDVKFGSGGHEFRKYCR